MNLANIVCPLPRIGSKDWGWKSEHDLYSTIVHTPKFGDYHVREFNSCAVYKDGDGYAVSDVTDLATAKRIAELLARRDWRRENRGKK